LGHFEEARQLYEVAHRAHPDPAFLFNIAQCYRMLDCPVEASRQYRAFLREAPGAPNRAEVEQRIRDMDAAVARREAAKPPTGVTPPRGAVSVRAAPVRANWRGDGVAIALL